MFNKFLYNQSVFLMNLAIFVIREFVFYVNV